LLESGKPEKPAPVREITAKPLKTPSAKNACGKISGG